MQTTTRYHCPITRCSWTFDATTVIDGGLSVDPWEDVQRVAVEHELRRVEVEWELAGHLLGQHNIDASDPVDVEALRAEFDRVNG